MYYRYASPLYVDMKKRTQIAIPHDPNNPIRNPNDQFVDEDGPDGAPWIKVFIGKVRRKEKKRNRKKVLKRECFDKT